MEYRALGGRMTSVIGFGGWAIGGDAYGAVDSGVAARALFRARELGVTLFDSADCYGAGRSEVLIGQCATAGRASLTIATKGGYTDYIRRFQDFSKTYLASALGASLRRLGTDYVDIYYLHSPPRLVLESNEAISALSTFQEAGKIRLRGISVRHIQDAALLLERGAPVDVIQLAYSFLARHPLFRDVAAESRRRNVSLVIRSPLCFGFLAGRRASGPFGLDDHRSRWPIATRLAWEREATRFEFLRIDGLRTLAQAAIRYCADLQDITAVIPGMKSVRQVEENIGALGVPALTASDLSRIESLASVSRIE